MSEQRRLGLWLAFASLAVNAPRLMVVYLKADGVPIAAWIEIALISLSGVTNGLVLAGAGIVIAQTLARTDGSGVHPAVRPLMLVTWVASLLFAVALITPAFVSGIRKVALSDVLQGNILQWGWSAIAVVAVEVAAAGCMLADAALNSRFRAPRNSQVRKEPAIMSEAPRSAIALAPSAAPLPALPPASEGPETIRCELCDKEIRNTTNARNAHKRFCQGQRPAE